MSTGTMISGRRRPGTDMRSMVTTLVLATAGTLALGLFALNDQSLWTDELGTWRLTVADSWRDWLMQLITWPNSDSQIPLFHLYMRAWTQVFPSTEVWMRAANLPWVFVALIGVLTTPVPAAQRRLVLIFGAVLLLHPMVWYYTNEARPYAMLFAGSCFAGSGLLARMVLESDSSRLPDANGRLIAGVAIMAGTSVLGVIWSIAFLLPVLGTLRRRADPSLAAAAQISFGNVVLALACGLMLLPVGYHYAWTALHGISATNYYENSLANFAFGLYEIAGFSGIGPGREELRTVGAAGLTGWLIPLTAYGIVVAAVIAVGLRASLDRNRRQTMLVLMSAFIPLGVLFVLGALKHWRVVGRHMMPLVVFFSLYLSFGLDALLRMSAWNLGGYLRRALAGVTLAAMAFSSIDLAYAKRHRREDFRSAAGMAASYLERNDRVWWAAYLWGASYYHLPFVHPSMCESAGSQAAILLESPDSSQLADCPEPQIIFIGRNDTEGSVHRYAAEHHFHRVASLTGFEIFGK